MGIKDANVTPGQSFSLSSYGPVTQEIHTMLRYSTCISTVSSPLAHFYRKNSRRRSSRHSDGWCAAFDDFNVCFYFPLIGVAIALNIRKTEH